MKRIQHYESPAILRVIPLQPEGELLAGSIVDNASIISAGQTVEVYDFSTDQFNHTWED